MLAFRWKITLKINFGADKLLINLHFLLAFCVFDNNLGVSTITCVQWGGIWGGVGVFVTIIFGIVGVWYSRRQRD